MSEMIEWVEEKWKLLVVFTAMGLFFLILLIVIFVFFNREPEGKQEEGLDLFEELRTEQLEDEEKSVPSAHDIKQVEEPVVFLVDIKGEVNQPGVYEVEKNNRVVDIVNLAGGFTDEAESKQINLAQLLEDQMMIYIPKIGEEVEIDSSLLSKDTESQVNQLININEAEVEELTQLKGIGETRAKSIIEYREENGRFATIEEIKEVSGIGDGIFAGIMDEITVE